MTAAAGPPETYRLNRRRLLVPALMAVFAAAVIVAAMSTVRDGAPGAEVAIVAVAGIVLLALVALAVLRIPRSIELSDQEVVFTRFRGRRRSVPLRDLTSLSLMPVRNSGVGGGRDEMVTWTWRSGSITTFRSLYPDFDTLRRHVRERAPGLFLDH